jgi:hypothetical protein
MTIEILGKTYTARKFGILTTQRLMGLLMRFEEEYKVFNSDSTSKVSAEKARGTWREFCEGLFVEDISDLDLDSPEVGREDTGAVSGFFAKLQDLVMQRWSDGKGTSPNISKKGQAEG